VYLLPSDLKPWPRTQNILQFYWEFMDCGLLIIGSGLPVADRVSDLRLSACDTGPCGTCGIASPCAIRCACGSSLCTCVRTCDRYPSDLAVRRSRACLDVQPAHGRSTRLVPPCLTGQRGYRALMPGRARSARDLDPAAWDNACCVLPWYGDDDLMGVAWASAAYMRISPWCFRWPGSCVSISWEKNR
jgi:hypothetical protein